MISNKPLREVELPLSCACAQQQREPLLHRKNVTKLLAAYCCNLSDAILELDSVVSSVEGGRKTSLAVNPLLTSETTAPSDGNAPISRLDPAVLQRGIDAGAKLCQSVPNVVPNTILGIVLLHGSLACVQVCLAVPHRLNFSVKGKFHKTALHYVSERLDRWESSDPALVNAPQERRGERERAIQEAAAVLRCIVERLVTHPSDEVDWGSEDVQGYHFLSFAATKQGLLVPFWRVLCEAATSTSDEAVRKRLGPFAMASAKAPVRLQSPVHWRDWSALKQEEQGCFFRDKPLQASHPHTVQLLHALEHYQASFQEDEVHRSAPAERYCSTNLLETVKHAVQHFADVHFYSSVLNCELMEFALSAAPLACVKALLESPDKLNLTVAVSGVCLRSADDEAALALQCVVDRVNSHVEDVLSWEANGQSRQDFVSQAAEMGCLSTLWPVLKKVEPYQQSSLKLTIPVWQWDWEAVQREEEKVNSHFMSGDKFNDIVLYSESRSTCVLMRVVMSKLPVRTAVVARLVEVEKANLNFRSYSSTRTIFHLLMPDAPLGCLLACLRAPYPLDFTLLDSDSCTVFHRFFLRENIAHDLPIFGKALIQRIESHPQDTIDFGLVDALWQLDFISLVAKAGFLATMWPLLQNAPYYADHVAPIPLRAGVQKEDWALLDPSQKLHFLFSVT